MVSCELIQTIAALPRTERGQYLTLGGDPKKENFLYANGNSVIIRNLKDESISDVYTQHSVRVNVAKYSPSRYYIASADNHGKIRIWDTTQKEHPLKAEYQPFAGNVNDLSWSSDNTKLAIGGEGREKFGAVINIETGTNVGGITGMSKSINNLDMKPTRPFRLATSAEDSTVCFLEGPPFKFKTSHLCHTNFANCLRYSPTGDYFVSAGADGKMFLFDGKEGTQVKEIGDPAHNGGIYSISFSGDGNHVMSVGGDKTMRIWSIPSCELIREHVFGKEVCHIQLGCLWSGDDIVSVSMPGDMTFFSAANLLSSDPVTPTKLVTGHQKPIISLSLTHDRELVSADSEGRIMKWDIEKGSAQQLGNHSSSVKGHGVQINDISTSGRELITVGMDDRMILTDLDSGNYRDDLKLNSQPRRVHQSSGFTAIACYKELVLTQGMNPVHSFPVKYEPVCLAVSPDGKILVAGGESDQKLYVYLVEEGGCSLREAGFTSLPLGHPRDLCFSPDGQFLICGDTERIIHVFNVDASAQTAGDNASGILQVNPDIKQKWKYHTARVSCVSMSPNSKLVATGSLDCSIIVWNLEKPLSKFVVKNAHPMSHVNSLVWVDDNTFYSAGQDANIKKWRVTLQ